VPGSPKRRLFPLPVAILPLYLLLRQMGLVDSLWAVILPQVAFGLPWNILLLRSFFLAIPRDLEDAAYVDGALLHPLLLACDTVLQHAAEAGPGVPIDRLRHEVSRGGQTHAVRV